MEGSDFPDLPEAQNPRREPVPGQGPDRRIDFGDRTCVRNPVAMSAQVCGGGAAPCGPGRRQELSHRRPHPYSWPKRTKRLFAGRDED